LGRHGIRVRVSPRTINYELRVLFTFFQWAVRRNYLFLNPAATVERFRIPKRAIPKFMTSEELKKFFGACSDDDRRLFMSILLTGMRKGEVEHLTWSDISFDLGVIFIQEKPEMKWKPKTDERLIPISPMLMELLLMQYQNRRNDTLVFPNQSGNIDTHILERLKRICRKAGIKQSTVHALRHSFGAHLRMAGASLADIGDLLGHRDLATTQIYAKVQQEHLRSVIAKLAPLVDGGASPTPGNLRLPPARPTSTPNE
jgi:integrase